MCMKPRFFLACCILLTLPLSGEHTHTTDDKTPTKEEKSKKKKHTPMHGMYGPYTMHREASGTAWVPDSSPMQGMSFKTRKSMLMLGGFANGIYSDQRGPRGDDEIFGSNMLMFMGFQDVRKSSLGFRTMGSLEPATQGKSGYPLLLQTGETGNGRTPLIDRQHPHDLFMELAVTAHTRLSDKNALFAYVGFPGEPAIGPPVFMMRFSGVNIPEAPITHHWLDSTHITWGVITLGGIVGCVKLDGSLFTGREPDEERYGMEEPKFDSGSVRLSVNPTKNSSFQVSYAAIHSPELLEPEIDTGRITASFIYNLNWGDTNWQTILAWGRNVNSPGHTLDAFLAETTLRLGNTKTLFARYENVEKDELFLEDDPRAGMVFTVEKVLFGYIQDTVIFGRRFGFGAAVTVAIVPDTLVPVYGKDKVSYIVFARVML